VNSLVGAPIDRTATLPSEVLEATLTVKATVVPGALKMVALGLVVTCAADRGEKSRRPAKSAKSGVRRVG
jgi:hypothetical protein